MSESSLDPLLVEDRILWPDGTISVDPDSLTNYLFKLSPQDLQSNRLYVTSMTPEIIEYNTVCDFPLTVKSSCTPKFPPGWKLPNEYLTLDLDSYLIGLADRVEQDELYEQRIERLSQEIWKFKQLNLDAVLRALIYVIDTMRAKSVVWGVGRGSSCSSYLLFLMGLHEVDPVKYGIDLDDFLHD